MVETDILVWWNVWGCKIHTDYAEEIYHLSALTHAHTRSKIGCLIYSKIIAGIIANQDADKFGIVEKSLLCCKEYFDLLQDKEIDGEEELYSRGMDHGACRKNGLYNLRSNHKSEKSKTAVEIKISCCFLEETWLFAYEKYNMTGQQWQKERIPVNFACMIRNNTL